MSDDNDDQLFPSAWGWEQFESGFREYAKRIAHAIETHRSRGEHHFENDDGLPDQDPFTYEGIKLRSWTDRQMLLGTLPSFEDMQALSPERLPEYGRVFRLLVAEARLDHRGYGVTSSSATETLDLSARFNPPIGDLVPKNDNGSFKPERPAPESVDQDFGSDGIDRGHGRGR